MCECYQSDNEGYYKDDENGNQCAICSTNYFKNTEGKCKTKCIDTEGDDDRNCYHGTCNTSGTCVCDFSDDKGFGKINQILNYVINVLV